MLTREYVEKALASCVRALEELEQGDKRKALGSLDFVTDRITAAKWTLIDEIKNEEGEL